MCVYQTKLKFGVLFILSYSTVVLYSRDHEGVGIAPGKILIRNHTQKSFTATWHYWSGIIKPKGAFRMIQNVSNEKIFIRRNFLLTDCLTDWLPDWLMPSDKHNSTMANAMGFISPLFNVAWVETCLFTNQRSYSACIMDLPLSSFVSLFFLHNAKVSICGSASMASCADFMQGWNGRKLIDCRGAAIRDCM